MRTGIIAETRLTDTEFFFSYDVRVVLFVIVVYVFEFYANGRTFLAERYIEE